MRDFGFGNLQFVPGLGYVQPGTQAQSRQARSNGLGDDSAVMMISGLNDAGAGPDALNAPVPQVLNLRPGITAGPLDALKTPISLFNVTLPLWAWLAIAALLGGAGGYWQGKKA